MKMIEEEILEAVFNAEEEKKYSIEDIKVGLLTEKIKKEDLESMEKNGFIKLSEGKILFTKEGKEIALHVVRRHRLAECLMGYVLNIPAEQMEKVACEMEHTLLPEVEESICILLGHPDTAPDGKPVPPGNCCLHKRRNIEKTLINLTELEVSDEGKIAYIRPGSHSRLQKLTAFGLIPGQYIKLQQKTPAYCILYDQTELAIDGEIAREIYVWKV